MAIVSIAMRFALAAIGPKGAWIHWVLFPSGSAGELDMPYMTQVAVRQAFILRGWVSQQGNFYFDGNGGSAHPHLHLMIEARGTVQTPPGANDIRSAVKMLAWSDGQQHNGGGGRLLIRVGPPGFVQGNVDSTVQNEAFLFANLITRSDNLAAIMGGTQSNQNINAEMGWIWSYFQGR